jgi:hypothetical protein
LETDKIPTDEELVRWSAEVLMEFGKDGEYYRIVKPDGSYGNRVSLIRNWNPLNKSNGQIWDCVERMREGGHRLHLNHPSLSEPDKTSAGFSALNKCTMPQWYRRDTNPRRAILLAAWRAVEGKR